MSEIQCPICNAQSPENALFCQNCGQPLKCQGCGANLLPTARACIQCGKHIPERSNNDQFQVGMSVVPPGYNRLKFHEAYAADVRDLDLTVSDHAITQIGAYIGDLMPSLMGTHLKGQKGSAVDHHSQKQPDTVEVSSDTPPPQPQLPAALHSKSSEHSPEQGIWDIFLKTGDGGLKQDIPTLKANSKRDYTIRLVYLFLYAKLLLGEESVSRTDVYTMLDDVGLKDGNTANNISLAKGISSDGNETLRLNFGGRQAAQQYIKDVFNPDLTDVWYPGADIRSSSTRGKKQNKKSADQQNTVDADVARWALQEGSNALVDKVQHEKVSGLPIMDKLLLALYGISEAGIKREVPVAAIIKYLYKAFKIEVKSNSVSKKIYEERRGKTTKASYFTYDGHGYEITPSGRNYIENLLNLKKPQFTTSDINASSNGAAQP